MNKFIGASSPATYLAGFVLLLAILAGLGSNAWFHQFSFPRLSKDGLLISRTKEDLRLALSQNSSIFGPTDPAWSEATFRYQESASPDIRLVVQPALESDIATIVHYANRHNLDYMLVNRGHSLTNDASRFSGLQIDVTRLRAISINETESTARFQAGVYSYEVNNALYEHGYATTTGGAHCVGLAGLMLGGGHGLYQGKYGLISDNVLSMNVVLANGSSIMVSEQSHSDLWWAMRGAGHNFGIVTSYVFRIFPADPALWYYRKYVFAPDKMEAVFQASNEIHQNGTVHWEMAYIIVVAYMDPEISTTEASMIVVAIYAGPKEDADPVLQPLDHIGEFARRDEGFLPYTQIGRTIDGGLDSGLCAKGKQHITTTIGLQVYNLTAQRKVFDLYNTRVAQHPELASTKLVHQAYSNMGVTQKNAEGSAFPLRDDYLLMYFDAMPTTSSGLRGVAKTWADQTRDLWQDGQPGRQIGTYVNYASGDETLQSLYGYEAWRLQKLTTLKKAYDPQNKFRFYNPIIRD